MGVNIKSGFKRKTAKGRAVYRIYIDNNEFLSNLEQGNTMMAIDICTNKYGEPSVYGGKSKKGYAFKAVHYYTWAIKPTKGELDENGKAKQNAWTASS